MKPGIDYIGVGIGAVIVNAKGELFLAKRGEKAKNERGKWEFPGGAIEFGETLQEAIIREIDEEFGICINPHTLLSPINHILPNEKQHWVSFAYICSLEKGTPHIKEKEKIAEIGWFTVDQIASLSLTIPAQQNYQEYKQYTKTHITAN